MNVKIVHLRYLRMTPRKVRAVGDLIRGLSVNEAEAQLLINKRRAAKPLLKLLRSALANVKNNQPDFNGVLFVQSIRVDQGPMLKRFLPRARGVASPIQKKMSHVTLVLDEQTEPKKPRFVIVAKKKSKSSETKKSGRSRAPQENEEKDQARSQKPTIFRKLFSRKSGMGK